MNPKKSYINNITISVILNLLITSCISPYIIEDDRNKPLPRTSYPQTPPKLSNSDIDSVDNQPATTTKMPRLALIIGNGSYKEFNQLSNPVNDATDMANVLVQLGFEVIVKTNATKKMMTEAVQLFGNKLAQYGGVGLFYFSGHGVQYEGNNYLIPLTTNIKNDADIEFEALNANRVLEYMQQANNGINIVILDACRNSFYTSNVKGSGKGLARMDSPSGSLIAYATAPNETAYGDESSRNSIYTKHLLTVLRSKPYLSITDLFTEVTGRVTEETQDQQVPWQSASLTQRFSFAIVP